MIFVKIIKFKVVIDKNGISTKIIFGLMKIKLNSETIWKENLNLIICDD